MREALPEAVSAGAIRAPVEPRSTGGRVWAPIVAGWGVVAGVAPHGLHHSGRPGGAALVAGFGGNVILFALGIALSAPMLHRLHRRFGPLVAPAFAVVAFAAAFTLSSLAIAPRLTGADKAPSSPGVQQRAAHESHHQGGNR